MLQKNPEGQSTWQSDKSKWIKTEPENENDSNVYMRTQPRNDDEMILKIIKMGSMVSV